MRTWRCLLILAFITVPLLVGCAADEAIEEGTDCDETCPVGAQKVSAKEASGNCGADGAYVPTGEVEAAGQCSGTGECQVVCLFPECGENKTLVITKDEFRCEANTDPCKDVDCDGHGTCKIVYDAAACDCDPGYVDEGLHCVLPKEPAVTTVTPNTGNIDVEAVFTVNGNYLPNSLAAEVEGCTGLSFTERGPEQQKFVCTPTEPGTKARRIFTETGGTKLFEDEVIFKCAACAIDGECVDEGDENPDNPCEICDSDAKDNGWSNNNGYDCDDGEFCNGDDSCEGGACAHAGDPCPDDGNYCNGVESCNEEDDVCETTGDPCVQDGSFCNGVETCDEDNDTCVSPGDPCPDDEEFCNGVESCDEDNDICITTGDPCPDDGAFCNGDESCNETDDVCESSGNPCEANQQCSEGQQACLDEIPVHPTTVTNEWAPDVDMWPEDGSFVVVWQAEVKPIEEEGEIQARVFSLDGTPLTDVLTIEESWTAKNAAVSTLDSDRFVVVWEDQELVYARVMYKDGNPYGATSDISGPDTGLTQVSGGDVSPDVARASDTGTFLVSWQPIEDGPGGTGRWRHRLVEVTPGAVPVAEDYWSPGEESDYYAPSAEGLFSGSLTPITIDGGFVDAGVGLLFSHPDDGLKGVLYVGNGVFDTDPIDFIGPEPGYHFWPAAAILQGGGIFPSMMGVWLHDGGGTKPAGVYWGMATPMIADEFTISTSVKINQNSMPIGPAVVASNGADNAVVAWTDANLDGDEWTIVGREIGDDLNFVGDEFVVNLQPAGFQHQPVLAMHTDGRWVAVWITQATLENAPDVMMRIFD